VRPLLLARIPMATRVWVFEVRKNYRCCLTHTHRYSIPNRLLLAFYLPPPLAFDRYANIRYMA